MDDNATVSLLAAQLKNGRKLPRLVVRRLMRVAVILLPLLLIGAAPEQTDPFVALSEAYRIRDAAAAGAMYSSSATVIYRYDGAPEERHVGTTAITQSFRGCLETAA